MRKHLPALSDMSRKQFENQFSRAPGDPLFSDEKKVVFVTGVEAGAGWSFDFIAPDGEQNTRAGSGGVQFYYPVAVAELRGHAGISRFNGFYLPIG